MATLVVRISDAEPGAWSTRFRAIFPADEDAGNGRLGSLIHGFSGEFDKRTSVQIRFGANKKKTDG